MGTDRQTCAFWKGNSERDGSRYIDCTRTRTRFTERTATITYLLNAATENDVAALKTNRQQGEPWEQQRDGADRRMPQRSERV